MSAANALAIREVVNDICDDFNGDFRSWHILCTSVQYDADGYTATVEGADPKATGIHTFLLKRLAELGINNVAIETEW